jgi:hypothetical protein
LPAATLVTPLPTPLQLSNGETLTTVGDAVIYFTHLTRSQQAKHTWQRTIEMFNVAINETAYLGAATITLQTALRIDGLLADPNH